MVEYPAFIMFCLTPRKYVFWRHSNWSMVITISMSSFDPAFDRSTKVTIISRSLRTKNPWYVSVFCRFDLLDGFFTLKKFFATNSGTGKSFCVVYYVQLLNRAGLTKRRQCFYNRPLQDCQKQRWVSNQSRRLVLCVNLLQGVWGPAGF